MPPPAPLAACPCCGLIQALPALPPRHRSRCRRCHTTLRRAGGRPQRRHERTAALAMAALLLYPVAVTLPVMRVARLGQVHEASVWSGTVELLADGEIVIGLIVLLCSLVLPLAKLAALFVLSSARNPLGDRLTARTWRMVEMSGRWGMLDVLLVAALVALVKLGELVSLTAGPGVIAFAACVLLNLAASASFDPHLLWETRSRETAV